MIRPRGPGGFEISFSGSASFRFVPAGPPTTDNRPMRDEQGRLWLMSGHRRFELIELAAAVDHSFHSKVKPSGHGQPTVTLYAEPSHGAAIAGMGASGDTLDKLACTTNHQGTWCRVGFPDLPRRRGLSPH